MALLLILGILILLTLYQNLHFKITKYDIVNTKIPAAFDGYKILQLADLHSIQFGKRNKDLIKQINEIDPDIIVITGDMMNKYKDDGKVFIDLISDLKGNFPVYYIDGNHELFVKSKKKLIYDEYINALEKLGVMRLDNESIKLFKKLDSINLYGFELPLEYYTVRQKLIQSGRDITSADVINSIGYIDDSCYAILLAHNPFYADIYQEWGADLVLSGHVHGGIINIPFIGGLLSPERKFFPKFDKGIYTIDQMKLIVSVGLGNSTIPFRLFNMPEVVLITLKSTADQFK